MTGSNDCVWLVGLASPEKYPESEGDNERNYPLTWDLIAICTSKEKAIEMCRTKNHFIGPVEVDIDLGDEPMSWPEAYYPKEAEECK